ncbi:MAG TPA: hypothetical protein VN933_09005 [Candidatus Eremiobacteraceae bacterium]|jgi:hypothetical protein|nr:hypothetical protein [Candidatus Eremiobacteraceae bacterium]
MSVTSPQSVGIQTGAIAGRGAKTKRAGLWDTYFYFAMSLLMTAVVVAGFSLTMGARIIHPAVRPPTILYIHAFVFWGWLAFFIFQSALVRTHNVRLHRTAGWFGVALGVVIPGLGISTALVMDRIKMMADPRSDAAKFMLVPFNDIFCFAIPFALAIYWRKKPEFHRRLILIASCALTAAAWGRFPESILPGETFYAGVDLLIFLGVVRDWIVNRRIHVVYRYALPAFIVAQAFVAYTIETKQAYWLKIADAMVR